MDDIEALQRTVRRVGAVLTVPLGLLLFSDGLESVGFVLTVGAALYLLGSVAVSVSDPGRIDAAETERGVED